LIEILFVVAFAMAVTEAVHDYLPTKLVPFAALGLVIVLNLLNAVLFGGDLLEAGKLGFIEGGIAIGIFAAGNGVRKVVAKE
jgi:hypothetical protein